MNTIDVNYFMVKKKKKINYFAKSLFLNDFFFKKNEKKDVQSRKTMV